jgi:hypothetical protein
MAGTHFIPLDCATTPPRHTHCPWKTARDNPALVLFVQLRDASTRPLAKVVGQKEIFTS